MIRDYGSTSIFLLKLNLKPQAEQWLSYLTENKPSSSVPSSQSSLSVSPYSVGASDSPNSFRYSSCWIFPYFARASANFLALSASASLLHFGQIAQLSALISLSFHGNKNPCLCSGLAVKVTAKARLGGRSNQATTKTGMSENVKFHNLYHSAP